MNGSPAAGPEAIEERSDTLVKGFVRPLFEEVAGPVGATPAEYARRRRAERRVADALAVQGADPSAARAFLRDVIVRWSNHGFRDDFAEAASLEEALPAEPATPEDAHRAEILRTFDRIEIRGLQTSTRINQKLEVAYVPLSLEEEASTELIAGVPIRSRVSVTDAVGRHPRLLVLGAPGSGKSTLSAWLACNLAQSSHAGPLADLLPFVVLVRAGGDPLSVKGLAASCRIPVKQVETLLKRGRALVIVDGLDEAREPERFFAQLREFAERWPKMRMVATARPAAVEGVPFPGFHTVRVAPLTTDEIADFVERWCRSAEYGIQANREDAERTAMAAAADLTTRIRASRPVQQLATNPLVCGVVCVVHRFLGQRIPERRAALYEVCANVLLYDWDRARFPPDAAIGRLDAHQKRSLLGAVAWAMHGRRAAELPEADVRGCLAERLPEVGAPDEDAGRILDEIRFRSGLLVERSVGVFGFSHLAFQEYFAAREATRLDVVETLSEHADDPWWHEVIVLAAGMPDARPAGLIRGLLAKDRKAVGVGTVLAAQCVAAAVEVPLAVRREVEERLKRLLPAKDERRADRIVAVGPVIGPLLESGLRDGSPDVRGYTARCVLRLGHEPLFSAVEALLGDEADMRALRVAVGFYCALNAILRSSQFPAALALLAKGRANDAVERALVTCSRVAPDTYAKLIALGITPVTTPEKPPPKRAARTG
jgi:hypothetical protein